MKLTELIALSVYGLVMRALQPLLRFKLLRRGRQESGYLHQIPLRFGIYDAPQPQPGAVWVHALSLGETRSAATFIEALRRRIPGMRLLLTHSTSSGWMQGESLLRPGDVQTWLPWDTPEATDRFLKHHQPQVGILIETEVWPCLAHRCRQHQIPLILANARLNASSLRSAQRWSVLLRPAYRALRGVLAQTDADAQRLRQAGAHMPKVLGNLKFDVPQSAQNLARAQVWRAQLSRQGRQRPVVMLASSREGEEALWLQALAANAERAQFFAEVDVLWLVVPRHPQRFEAVWQMLQADQSRVFRRSELPTQGPWPAQATGARFWLGDSLGEMPLYYQNADLALLGGSFMPLGGHNLIESLAMGCPIIMGPHTFNFAQIAEHAQETGAAVRVSDMSAALDQALHWLSQATALAHARESGLQWVSENQGVSDRYAQAVMELLTPTAPPVLETASAAA